jgi:acyl-CoA synthetase (AMP-forming)/AMP-acid ligase II
VNSPVSGLEAHQRLAHEPAVPWTGVGSLFLEKAVCHPQREFVFFPADDLVLTYEDVRQAVNGCVAQFREAGWEKGDRLAVVFRNKVEFLILYLSCLTMGIVIVPINPDISIRETRFILEGCKAKGVYYDALFEKQLLPLTAELASHLPFCAVPGFPDFGCGNVIETKSLDRIAECAANVVGTDEAVILYTSGTTGDPKGVVLSQLNLIADASAMADWFAFDETVRTLCMLPLFHNNGQVVTLLAPLCTGGSSVIVDAKAGLLSFWSIIDKFGCNWTSVMPSMLATILAYSSDKAGGSLQGIVCGGQILSEELRTGFENTFGVPIFEGYGLTETTSFSCINRFPADQRNLDSVGSTLRCNRIEILDTAGSILGPNEEGEICVRGQNVAIEYLDLPAVNKEKFRGGWFHSGDYGHRDVDGNFYFRGRRDDLIIRGGENIYPAELENVLYMNPSVAECAVIGVPHPLLGEEIVAFVKTHENAIVAEADLIAFSAENIGQFKVPKRIFLLNQLEDLSELPKGPTKKVLYRELREYHRKWLV